MAMLGKDWAFFSLGKDQVLLGIGPFARYVECPKGQTAFYQNSFDLSEAQPWIVPQECKIIDRSQLSELFPSEEALSLHWQEPEVSDFASVFKEISDHITEGALQKSVPVVVEEAEATEAQFHTLPAHLSTVHPNLHPYGFYEGGEGAVGASPEFLLQSFEGKLKTMALAGTAREEDRVVFSVDQKEIQEHEFVAKTLLETLIPLGMTRRHERSILSLGSLIHFHTSVDVELYNSHRLDDLVEHLHPTPALGPLPRTEETMAQLVEYRSRLGCPAVFGAPFGVYHEGRFQVLVSIRMISYRQGTMLLPSGCGVIEASRLTSEWRELRLKRDSVRTFMGL